MKTLPEGAVAAALDSLKIDVVNHTGDELVARCPGHEKVVGKADTSPSWSINEKTGAHYCFSCGFRGNLYTLVRDLGDERQAQTMWSEFERHGHVALTSGEARLSLSPPTAMTETIRTAKELPESKILMYDDPPDWALHRRRITAASARDYKIKWNTAKHAWVLPLRWPDNLKLMGYQEKSEETRYFRNRPKDIRKSETLFGIDTVMDDVDAVVVESPLDAVLLHDMGYPAVAICGGRVSDEQLSLLSDFDRVFFWLDNDFSGKTEAQRLRSELTRVGVRATLIAPDTDWKDPGDTPFRHIDQTLHDAGL